MVASRNRPEGGLRTSLGLGVMMLLALPSEVGYQDLATLLDATARGQPRAENRASPRRSAPSTKRPTISRSPSGHRSRPPGLYVGRSRSRRRGHDRLAARTPARRRGRLRRQSVCRAGDRPHAARAITASRARTIAASRSRATGSSPAPGRGRARCTAQPAQEPGARATAAAAPPPGMSRRRMSRVASPSEPATPAQLAEPRPDSDAGRYSLASAGDYRAVDLGPKPSDVKSAYPMLAPPRDGDKDADQALAPRRERGRMQSMHRLGADRRRSVVARGADLFRRRSHGTTARSDRAVGARRGAEIRNQGRDRDQRRQHEAGGAPAGRLVARRARRHHRPAGRARRPAAAAL